MKPYEKTAEDTRREENDLKTNPLMRWLQNQDAFRFNPGDILIKKVRKYGINPHTRERLDIWDTEVITKATGAPKKYVYAFENALGIGYLRQLKANGTGYCGTLICVANFDPENTRFELDPDFIDHSILGEGEFHYNNEYATKKKFRQDAMEANRKLLVRTSSKKALVAWFVGLQPGDVFWHGPTFDELATTKYKVLKILKGTQPQIMPNYYGVLDKRAEANQYIGAQWQTIEVETLESPYSRVGSRQQFDVGQFHWQKVTMSQPHPMKDELCGPPK